MVIPLAIAGAGYGTYLLIGGIIATTGILAYNSDSLIAKNDTGFDNNDLDIFKPSEPSNKKEKNKAWMEASGESKIDQDIPPNKPEHNCNDFGSIENLKKKALELLAFNFENYPAALFAEQTEALSKGIIDKEEYAKTLMVKGGLSEEKAEKFTNLILGEIKKNKDNIGDFIYGLYNEKVSAEVMAGIFTGLSDDKCPQDVLIKFLANKISSQWATANNIGDPAKEFAEKSVKNK